MPYTHRKIGNKECVFKKEDGSKIGCTTGPIDKYLAALHANANESIKEASKPKIFTYTAYRLPNIEDLKEINQANLSCDSLLEGLQYTIIGRGILDNGNKSMIIEAINLLIKSNPDNKEYKKALEIAQNLNGGFITETNIIKGGKADKLTVKDIAKKFDIPISRIEKQLSLGKKVEHEHTDSMEKAIEIAMDHLSEFPDYYTRLSKMEKEAERHVKKIKVNESTKSLIKRLLRENIK